MVCGDISEFNIKKKHQCRKYQEVDNYMKQMTKQSNIYKKNKVVSCFFSPGTVTCWFLAQPKIDDRHLHEVLQTLQAQISLSEQH